MVSVKETTKMKMGMKYQENGLRSFVGFQGDLIGHRPV